MSKRQSDRSMIATLIAMTALFGVPAQAQGHSHDPGNPHVGHGDLLIPYVCSTDGDGVGRDFSAAYVNENHKLILRISNRNEDTPDFFCDNAGGVANLTHPTPFKSVSMWIRTSGGETPETVAIDLLIQGDTVAYFFFTDTAKIGPTINGYTLYTWTNETLAGLFPSNAVIRRLGYGINLVDPPGVVSVADYAFNGHSLGKPAPTINACPWNEGNVCPDRN